MLPPANPGVPMAPQPPVGMMGAGVRGGGNMIAPDAANLEQRLEALENQLRALHEEVRQTMQEMNHPLPEQPFHQPMMPQPPARPSAPAGR